jgi:hypothetical protein
MYFTEGRDPLTEQEMDRLIEDYRHDGATIERVRQPHATGVLVHLPGDPDRFYSEE